MRSLRILVVLLVLHVVCALPSLFQIGKAQSVAVKGKLLCNGEPIANVKLKLYDVDTVDLDDLMAEGKSDANGTFYLSGTETELTTIDPKLNIYHNCNDERKECLRKVSIVIPDSFVTVGERPEQTFDVGILNLSARLPGETRDCIN
uniref:Transthyretin-like protein 5 n=1 Tax=Ascaris suum TaxID=6253 RepID=F1LG97_ASCSU